MNIIKRICLGVVMAMGLSSLPAQARLVDFPPEIKTQLCGRLVTHFSYAYDLHFKGLEEALTQEIVAYDPDLDEILGFPVYAAIKALYATDKAPNKSTWIYATQLGCIETLGVDMRPAHVDWKFRPWFHDNRKDILWLI